MSEATFYATDVQEPSAEPTLGLHAKLVQVILAVESVPKDGTNTFHKYRYTTAETMLRAIRRPLAEQGVILLSSKTGISERDIQTAKGGTSTITTVEVRYTFIDAATGEREVLDWSGRGDDPADKGLGKAYTNAVKTFLREQFLLPMGDDPEADPATDERAAGRQTSPAKPPPTPQTLGADRAENLAAIVDEAGLTEHLPTKLRSFGVKALSDLTLDQGMTVYAWSRQGDAHQEVAT